jgi:hypothetical protein
MKMRAEKRAIDKIFRRRDRYDIPDWQRDKVWDKPKKQQLIDSILRGWKLPKFYFVEVGSDNFLIEDGQQRLAAIFDFFSNSLALSEESAEEFGGEYYRNLPRKVADTFDDFELEYDVIEDASDEELKEFFQRLQAGMALNSSEKLNAVHSKLRDFCMATSKHAFFKETIAIPNTRYAHFDIMAKVAVIEIEGLDSGLRFEDVRSVFNSNSTFSPASASGKRMKKALDLLQNTFDGKSDTLRSRTVVQSLVTLVCKVVSSGRSQGIEAPLRKFINSFMKELAHQVELGQNATDTDYLTFQQSINANVRGGSKTRQEILLRKLFKIAPELANIFDPSVIAESGVAGRIIKVADSIANLVTQINTKHSAASGADLFKATNKTVSTLNKIRKPVTSFSNYKDFIDDLYFLFREGPGSRLSQEWPKSFVDINDLRTDLRHDVDHGDAKKVRSKKLKIGSVFSQYAGTGNPEAIDPIRLPLVQANILGALEGDLRVMLLATPVAK